MDECETENCASRRFHVGDDGFTYCSESHRQTRIGLITVNDEPQLSQGRKTIRREKHENAIGLLQGTRGIAYYLQCLQLLLRKQVWWLTHDRNLPDELEASLTPAFPPHHSVDIQQTVVRHLWTLRLQSLRGRLEHLASDASSGTRTFTTQTEDDSSGTEPFLRKPDKTPADALMSILDCLGLCYVGLLLLRLPITVTELHSWVADGHLIYYRSSRSLDLAMRQRLHRRHRQLLDPPQLLTIHTLHQAVSDTLTMFQSMSGLQCPPLNARLLVYKWIRCLMLPLESFAATMLLADQLQETFAYNRGLRRDFKSRPECRLLSLLIVATRLIYPMDHVDRVAKRPAELGAAAPDWSTWAKAHELVDKTASVGPGSCLSYDDTMRMTERHVQELSESKMDQYLDWYGQMYMEKDPPIAVRGKREAGFRNALHGMFPTESRSAVPHWQPNISITSDDNDSVQKEALDMIQANLVPLKIILDGPELQVRRLGTSHGCISNETELEERSKLLYSKAASLVGLSLESMVQCTWSVERQLQRC